MQDLILAEKSNCSIYFLAGSSHQSYIFFGGKIKFWRKVRTSPIYFLAGKSNFGAIYFWREVLVQAVFIFRGKLVLVVSTFGGKIKL
jgi:hypothetical protein